LSIGEFVVVRSNLVLS